MIMPTGSGIIGNLIYTKPKPKPTIQSYKS